MNKSQQVLQILESRNQDLVEEILIEMIEKGSIKNQDELDVNVIALTDQYDVSGSFGEKLFKKLTKQYKLPKVKR